MNLGEGTRRLALLLGAIGVILGGFASYLELQSVLNQRVLHARFEQLANSDIVQQERKAIQEDPTSEKQPIPEGPVTVSAPDGNTYHFAEGTDKAAAIRYFKRRRIGIKAIHWTNDYGVGSIETEDSQTLYPTPSPAIWTYLLIALFPVFGFFIPWGAIRAFGWVVAGFFKSEERK